MSFLLIHGRSSFFTRWRKKSGPQGHASYSCPQSNLPDPMQLNFLFNNPSALDNDTRKSASVSFRTLPPTRPSRTWSRVKWPRRRRPPPRVSCGSLGKSRQKINGREEQLAVGYDGRTRMHVCYNSYRTITSYFYISFLLPEKGH